MKNYSAFDILGPIMIGPSSSHTAGAARLGKVSAQIIGAKINKVEFYLHGSFASTYKGHGTDRALIGGVLGMEPYDEGIVDAFEIAKSKKVEYSFIETEFEDAHPNTVKIKMYTENNEEHTVVGSSLGGGAIIITEIDGERVEFTGEYPTLIVKHIDAPGVISDISTVCYKNNINIASMRVYRFERGCSATMIFEVDSNIDKNIIEQMKINASVQSVRYIAPIK